MVFRLAIFFKAVGITLAAGCGLYFAALATLAGVSTLQAHVFYLHRVSLIWGKDLNIPEQFGFAPRQVASFFIETATGGKLHAWHILPINTYHQNVDGLLKSRDEQHHLELLKSDPDARLVIYLYGTAGCLASGWRPDSYRAMYATASDHIHVISFDYRGYGLSSGDPTESGLLEDAVAIAEWAMTTAGIPPSRIVIYGQSLGTAVAFSLMQYYASLPKPVQFSGHVLTASFSDVATLTATYRIGGVIPVLSPLAKVPVLLNFFTSFLTSTWMSKDRISEYIQSVQGRPGLRPHHLTLIHAQDDSDIACEHSNVLFWHAVNASSSTSVAYADLEVRKQHERIDLGQGGWMTEHRTGQGLVRQMMLRYGTHDKLMAFPITSLAILDAFKASDPAFMAQGTDHRRLQ